MQGGNHRKMLISAPTLRNQVNPQSLPDMPGKQKMQKQISRAPELSREPEKFGSLGSVPKDRWKAQNEKSKTMHLL